MTSILVVTERYWPDGSGGELATHLIVDALRKRFNVIVVTGTGNPSRVPGVEYIYEPLLSKREKPVLWVNTSRLVNTRKFQGLLHESNVVYIPRFAFPIIPHAKRLGKKAVVHLHDYIPISYTATVLAPYEEHRHRITLDDIKLECMRGLNYCLGINLLWWLPKLARKWISQADKIICVSRRQAEIIADQAPELRDKIEVVYNPLPPETINAGPRKELDDIPTFLYVGGDSYIKGFHILLKAIKELGRQGVKIRLILANRYSHESMKILNTLSHKYENLRIEVVGRVEYHELIKLYEKAWALVFPSIWEEPLPYAIVESLLTGTIPITSKVGGIIEIVDKIPAEKFLFTSGDIDEFIGKIEMFISLSKNEVLDIGTRLREHTFKIFDKEKLRKTWIFSYL
ncbi:MAG: glycosyltransferase family 4 protein [Desulfurococcaceae archaeon]|jgi:glycosyltransferase involved in cell wall biosynthesis|nr:glycosyltransferase family 4 protein [Desulfurococcaceae archaeon]